MTEEKPHDGAQSQLHDDTGESAGATPADPRERLAAAPPVPTAGQKTADSDSPGTSPPGVRAANTGLPSVAAPGKPDGEVDTRR